MEDRERTLVALLSMHRCGSSLTAQVLQKLGMSLGPFELIGSAPTNPYGHFEAVPFHSLNRRIQNLVYGFTDDLPESPDVLARFCVTRGHWDLDTYLPEEVFAEGRALVRTLIDSGAVSGFKDPRTVLTWPFWERVFADFPDVRTIPVGLIRSPHEIAMSLVTRRSGWSGYWPSLDVIAIHFEKQQRILETQSEQIPCLCFGSPSYLKTLEVAVRQIGLAWNASEALELFDHSAVHQRPAAIAHQAQELFESMCGEGAEVCADLESRMRQEKDARLLESLRLEQWKSNENKMFQAREEVQRLSSEASELKRELRETRTRLGEAEKMVSETQSQLSACERKLIHSQDREIEAQDREIQAQNREIEALHRSEQLRGRLDRFEMHPLLGPALRGRRRLKHFVHSVSERPSAETNGSSEHGTTTSRGT